MVIKLKFNAPLYVSTGRIKDQVKLEIVEPRIFVRKASGVSMTADEALNNTLIIELQTAVITLEDFERASSVSSQNQNILGINMIIGFTIQLFLKMSVEYIWTTLNMLQIVSHTRNFSISIPAQLIINLDKLMALCNFQIQDIQFVQEGLREFSIPFVNFLNDLGIVLCFLIVMMVLISSLILIRMASKRYENVQKVVKKLLNKLMWNSLLRNMIQGYFIQSYTQMNRLDVEGYKTSSNFAAYFQLYASLIVAFTFPLLSSLFLFYKRSKLQDDEFQAKFGSLYTNMRTFTKSNKLNLLWLTFFLAKRLILVIITIWLKWFPWSQIAIFQFVQLFVLMHLLYFLPMNSKALNFMEALNELFVYLTSYALLLFTDLLKDIETRYQIGEWFMNLLLAIITIDCLIIIAKMIEQMQWRIRLYLKKQLLIKDRKQKQEQMKKLIENRKKFEQSQSLFTPTRKLNLNHLMQTKQLQKIVNKQKMQKIESIQEEENEDSINSIDNAIFRDAAQNQKGQHKKQKDVTQELSNNSIDELNAQPNRTMMAQTQLQYADIQTENKQLQIKKNDTPKFNKLKKQGKAISQDQAEQTLKELADIFQQSNQIPDPQILKNIYLKQKKNTMTSNEKYYSNLKSKIQKSTPHMINKLRENLMKEQDLNEAVKIENVQMKLQSVREVDLFTQCMVKLKVLNPKSQQMLDLLQYQMILREKESQSLQEDEDIDFNDMTTANNRHVSAKLKKTSNNNSKKIFMNPQI